MLHSELFCPTLKEFPKDEVSKNAGLLIKAGYLEKVSAGIYNFLPLGWRVLNKIIEIVRKEMNSIGAQEILMPALHPAENWLQTNRWNLFDALFKLKSRTGLEYALGPTHEEIIFPLIKNKIKSYRDLPLALYQIQTKFRDELRAKAGILRGREFIMKDLYSFHQSSQKVEQYKRKVEQAYLRIFKKLNLKAIITKASGGTFSPYSTEFQVITESGEDTIYFCPVCQLAYNKEIIFEEKCPECQSKFQVHQAIEVANTFNLGDKFSKSFEVYFVNKQNQKELIFAGCYGLGITRTMGAIVEVKSDDYGLVWPEIISPYLIHLIVLPSGSKVVQRKLMNLGYRLYQKLLDKKIEVLFDERESLTPGEKLVESDLLGISWRVIISEKNFSKGLLEIKKRGQKKGKLVKLSELNTYIQKWQKLAVN